MTTTALSRIAELNDAFRTTFIGGRIMLSHDVTSLPEQTRAKLLHAVSTFSAFTDGNDPHNEHDFGAVTVEGEKYFFKMDYYDKSCEYGSDDPADQQKTTRVLTIMHCSEY